jgi:hypothetical protein
LDTTKHKKIYIYKKYQVKSKKKNLKIETKRKDPLKTFEKLETENKDQLRIQLSIALAL